MTARGDPNRHDRRSIRLKGYDYTQSAAYFVTICAKDRTCLFGDVDGNDMRLSEAGNMVAALWNSLTARFADIDLDAFVVMPNHIHGIIVLTSADTRPVRAPLVGAQSDVSTIETAMTATGATTKREPTRGAPTRSLGAVVGAYKSLTTVEFMRAVKILRWSPFAGKLWQRNFFEHIIRDDTSLKRIRQYIADNPARWSEDAENPARQPARSSVGAPLVGARFDRAAGQTGATPSVGAPLVGARFEAVPSAERATTRVAPTGHGDDEDAS